MENRLIRISVIALLSASSPLALAGTKAMLEQQWAATCTPQNMRTMPAMVLQCQLLRSQINALADEDDDDDKAGGTVVQPSMQPSYPRATQAAPARQSAPPVNQCVSVRMNQWGSRQFFNSCDFTVSISWCIDEQGSSSSCKAGRVDGQSLNFINPGSDQPVGGKQGGVHFVACRGGPSSGTYASLKNGQAECRQ